MLTDGFPAFLRDAVGASMTSAGLVAAVPQLGVAAVTAAGAVLADYMRGPAGCFTTQTTRCDLDMKFAGVDSEFASWPSN
jgi:hypothetical protein